MAVINDVFGLIASGEVFDALDVGAFELDLDAVEAKLRVRDQVFVRPFRGGRILWRLVSG